MSRGVKTTRVRSLGVFCDLEAKEDSRWSDTSDGELFELSFRLEEFVVLDDGSRVWFSTVSGFSTSAVSIDGRRLDPWELMTREGLEADIRNALLPDDDDSQDARPWGFLVKVLAGQGVTTSVGQLRRVPFVVEIAPAILARIGKDASMRPWD